MPVLRYSLSHSDARRRLLRGSPFRFSAVSSSSSGACGHLAMKSVKRQHAKPQRFSSSVYQDPQICSCPRTVTSSGYFEVAKSFGLLLLLLAASLWRSEDSSLTLGSPLVDKISTCSSASDSGLRARSFRSSFLRFSSLNAFICSGVPRSAASEEAVTNISLLHWPVRYISFLKASTLRSSSLAFSKSSCFRCSTASAVIAFQSLS
mmetsp:Transcript_97470/g.231988  ORF Transcript_97470/g.231988 Transcript_97470/m.231988 type:complete len:206 (+) Transcript_97470:148-765(+)